MTVYLYNVSDDPRVLDKTLGTAVTLNCELLYPSDLLNPRIKISAASFTPYLNYMYIQAFDRYYFITEVTYENGGAVTIQGKIDVLQTYGTSIKSLTVNVIRQELGAFTNVVDNMVTVTPKQDVSFVKCDATPFNIRTTGAETNFCLCIAGGAVGGE